MRSPIVNPAAARPAEREELAALLTDGRRMRPILALVLGEFGLQGAVTACSLHQVRRRINKRTEAGAAHWLEVCYQLELVDRDSGALELVWLSGRVGCPQPVKGVHCVAVAGLDLLLWKLPEDPALPQLAAFLDPVRAGAALGAAVDQVSLVRYEPGEHCTARFRLADGSVLFGKHYGRAAAYQRALRGQRALAAAGAQDARAFRVAEPVAVDALSAIFSAEQRGLPLSLRAAEAALQAQLAQAAAQLRALALDDVATLLPADWLALARKWRKKMVMADMVDAQRLDALIERLDASHPAIRPVTVHGDFHVDQMLIGDDGRLVLFDFDNLASGSACQDLADFVSQWQLAQQVVAHEDPGFDSADAAAADAADDAVDGLAPLIEGWSAPRIDAAEASVAELDWYLRLMFLRKAYSFFVHHTAEARCRIGAALAAAEDGLRRLPVQPAALAAALPGALS